MRYLAGLLCLLAWSLPDAIGGERLSDSLSPVQRTQISGAWEGPGFDPDNPADRTIVARTGPMEVRLAIPPQYTNPPRYVRIFLVVPITIIGLQGAESFDVSWTTGGAFLSGRARPGQRALIFEGVADRSVLSDTVSFSIRADGAQVVGAIDYETLFEIEAN